MIEQQRRIVHSRRKDIIYDRITLHVLPVKSRKRYDRLVSLLGEERLQAIEKELTLHSLDQCWADYLQEMSEVRESIHLVLLQPGLAW
ncbi:MAG: hypothetical protein GX434_01015 [Peptococcaceae bacterium]|nr:hypothetical protein [Peptococcaceae bacterium]